MSRASSRSMNSMKGFSLIEVMIAVLLISFGLLGMALLQSTALRAGQISNERTTATMLAHQLLDMVRTNRQQAASYNLIRAPDFAAAGDGRAGICAADAVAPTPQWQADRDAWVCAARRALPNAQGSVVVTAAVNASGGPTPSPASAGQITVTLSWEGDRTNPLAPPEVFVMTTGL